MSKHIYVMIINILTQETERSITEKCDEKKRVADLFSPISSLYCHH